MQNGMLASDVFHDLDQIDVLENVLWPLDTSDMDIQGQLTVLGVEINIIDDETQELLTNNNVPRRSKSSTLRTTVPDYFGERESWIINESMLIFPSDLYGNCPYKPDFSSGIKKAICGYFANFWHVGKAFGHTSREWNGPFDVTLMPLASTPAAPGWDGFVSILQQVDITGPESSAKVYLGQEEVEGVDYTILESMVPSGTFTEVRMVGGNGLPNV